MSQYESLRSTEEGINPFIAPGEKKNGVRNALAFDPGVRSNPRPGMHSRLTSRSDVPGINLSDVPYLNERRKLTVESFVMPRMIIPMLFMALWSTIITCICHWVYNQEAEGEAGKDDVIEKLTGINLILAFAIALKHRLRFEPEVAYSDLYGLVCHVDTFAKAAYDAGFRTRRTETWMNRIGEYLRIPFAIANPREAVKNTRKPIGNLPLEIMNNLSAYVMKICETGKMKVAAHQGQACDAIYTMEDAMNGTERVLNTPLPLAYAILITQITWIYALSLPFQLYPMLHWVTIPASLVATYIIHGLISVCAEIENPFGNDVNDLPLDIFCHELETDLDIITSTPPPTTGELVNHPKNMILYPLSNYSAEQWKGRSMEELRSALRVKATLPPATMSRMPSYDQLHPHY
ncbi:hypothetical protein KEM52_006192 [Ascosphaera acerosa]|nr:hypothetical protein KEM52_006192 [Ascosphaera acerosa]